MIAFVPGSFDPITYGHLDIIERCSNMFEQVIICPGRNSSKSHMFNLDERMYMISDATSKLDNVTIQTFDGLLAKFVSDFGGKKILVKGLRTVTDYEYEMQMAYLNKKVRKDVETFFMLASPQYSFLSSSAVKEIAKYGEDISDMVPPVVSDMMKGKLAAQ
ncbi:MAG: coaD or kdtB [Bacillales bacterium]|jgi:pantetheine-phosphate adenylyltransferase|nr:coaD or kdtB [Bacillales bacterium]